MFYDGYPGKGACSAGGGHVAQGFQFVLPHGSQPDIHLRSDLRTDGWAPIGGWVDLVLRQNGDYVFSGHIHNSGAVNIRYTLAVVLTTPAGQGYGFAVNNHEVDGTQTIIGRHRDDNWTVEKNDAHLAQNWSQVSQGSLGWRLVAADTVTRGIKALWQDILKTLCPTVNNPNKFVPCDFVVAIVTLGGTI
jgi:hypothetical protein